MHHSLRATLAYPALRTFVLLAAGIVTVVQHPVELRILFLPALCASACALLGAVLSLRWRAFTVLRDVALGALLMLAGMLLAANALQSLPHVLLEHADTAENVLLRGTVESPSRATPGGSSVVLRSEWLATATDTIAVNERLRVYLSRSMYDRADTLPRVAPGDVLELRGKLRSPRPARNPFGFDARAMLMQEGITCTFAVNKGSNVQRIEHRPPWPPLAMLWSVREEVARRIADLFAATHAAIMKGLLLGDRGDIDSDVLDDFRITGIMHVLAVSGLHAGIIVTMVLVPLQRAPYWLRGLLAVSAVWVFAGITGFAPPVTRAAIMSTVLIAGVLVQRRGASVNTLAVAGICIVINDPLALTGLSMQLSFGAVLGILLFHERITRVLSLPLPRRWAKGLAASLLSLLALTLAAQVCTLPLTTSTFGYISIVGVLVNLVVVPLVFVVVSCGMLAVCASLLSPWLASAFASTATGALDLVLLVSAWSAELPWAAVDVPALSAISVLLYILGILYFERGEGRVLNKYSVFVLLLGTALVWSVALRPLEKPLLRCVFLDVGQGDAIVLCTPSGRTMLVDTGPSMGESDSGARTIVPWLRRNGIDTLDALVLTHPDDDHIGGAVSVLEACVVRNVYIACTWPVQPQVVAVRQRIRDEGALVHDARAGDVIALDPQLRIHVLSPPDSVGCTASNEHSVVLHVRHGARSLLLTGDAEIDSERRMVTRYDSLLRADVLKVGHHGSGTSSEEDFLRTVSPAHAVITAGRLNRFRHPKRDVLARLHAKGTRVHRTDLGGAIIFESDGQRVWRASW